MSESLVVLRYLNAEQRVSLLDDLIEQDNFSALVGVIDAHEQLSGSHVEALFEKVVSKVDNEVQEIDLQNAHRDVGCEHLSEDMDIFAKIVVSVPDLWVKIERKISVMLDNYIRCNMGRCFSEAMKKVYESECSIAEHDMEQEETSTVITYLAFLELLFLKQESLQTLELVALDKILIVLQACNIENIATSCSRLMRWTHQSVVSQSLKSQSFDLFLWHVITLMNLEKDEIDWKQRVCLSLLLRILSNEGISDQGVQFVKTQEFWTLIHSSLNHTVHEYRKLGLSIVKLAILKIVDKVSEPLEHEMFKWDPQQNVKIIESWKRFTTLYEIVAVDTALNQIQDARNDIIDIFNDDNLPPTWSLLLFSTGLTASMESVRKYIVNIMLDIKNMSVFSANLNVLRTSFIPALMNAHFFNVIGCECPYGDKLSEFIKSIILASNIKSEIISSILELLIDQGTSFDPARIYVTYGILNCLNTQVPKSLQSKHFRLIRRLFEFECEEEVFETTLQHILLRLLLHGNNSISAAELVQSVVAHIKCQRGDFKYVKPLVEDFREHCVINFNPILVDEQLSPSLGVDSVFDAVAVTLFDISGPRTDINVIKQLIKLDNLQPEDNSIISTELVRLLDAKELNEYPKDCDILTRAKTINQGIWSNLNVQSLYVSLRENFEPEKFKFFVALYQNMINYGTIVVDFAFTDICDIYESIKKFNTAKKTDSDYKMKDSLYDTYFKLLFVYLKTTPLRQERNDIINILNILESNVNTDNGYYLGNLGAVSICQTITSTYLIPIANKLHDEQVVIGKHIITILSTIWDNISGERLILKERDLHLAFIDTLFHPHILLLVTTDSEYETKISKIGLDIISKAYSRRSLLPHLGKRINEFFMSYNSLLLKCEWMIAIMVNAFKTVQMGENVFKLKPVISKFYENHVSAFFGLQQSLYYQVYGDDEHSCRVHIISAILFCNNTTKNAIVKYIVTQTKALVPVKRTDGVEGLERLLLWQLILLCVVTSDAKSIEWSIFEQMLSSIEDESSPLVRICKEWSIAHVLAHQESEKLTKQANYLFSHFDDHSKPILVVTVEKIIYITLKAMVFDIKNEYFSTLQDRFVALLVANCTSNKPLVRHFSNSLILSFWPKFKEVLQDSSLKLILQKLYENSKEAQIVGQYRTGDANVWDLVDDCTLTGLFGGVLMKCIDHEVPYLSKSDFEKYTPQSTDLPIPIGIDENDKWLSKRESKNVSNPNVTSQNALSDSLQTKSGAWETVLDIDQKRSNSMIKRSELIVVSSLVDKPPNLGGICRLCDVLGVGLLTVQDLRVKNHPQFKNVAVTADKWMPMEEVPIDEISKFMKEKKKEGYTLIGLEQTDKSIKLDNNFKFPSKSLILLGTEAHGIPGHLLNELDLCLEIKQHGVIRSMNIQTATAVIVHSYSAQIL